MHVHSTQEPFLAAGQRSSQIEEGPNRRLATSNKFIEVGICARFLGIGILKKTGISLHTAKSMFSFLKIITTKYLLVMTDESQYTKFASI